MGPRTTFGLRPAAPRRDARQEGVRRPGRPPRRRPTSSGPEACRKVPQRRRHREEQHGGQEGEARRCQQRHEGRRLAQGGRAAQAHEAQSSPTRPTGKAARSEHLEEAAPGCDQRVRQDASPGPGRGRRPALGRSAKAKMSSLRTRNEVLDGLAREGAPEGHGVAHAARAPPRGGRRRRSARAAPRPPQARAGGSERSGQVSMRSDREAQPDGFLAREVGEAEGRRRAPGRRHPGPPMEPRPRVAGGRVRDAQGGRHEQRSEQGEHGERGVGIGHGGGQDERPEAGGQEPGGQGDRAARAGASRPAARAAPRRHRPGQRCHECAEQGAADLGRPPGRAQERHRQRGDEAAHGQPQLEGRLGHDERWLSRSSTPSGSRARRPAPGSGRRPRSRRSARWPGRAPARQRGAGWRAPAGTGRPAERRSRRATDAWGRGRSPGPRRAPGRSGSASVVVGLEAHGVERGRGQARRARPPRQHPHPVRQAR